MSQHNVQELLKKMDYFPLIELAGITDLGYDPETVFDGIDFVNCPFEGYEFDPPIKVDPYNPFSWEDADVPTEGPADLWEPGGDAGQEIESKWESLQTFHTIRRRVFIQFIKVNRQRLMAVAYDSTTVFDDINVEHYKPRTPKVPALDAADPCTWEVDMYDDDFWTPKRHNISMFSNNLDEWVFWQGLWLKSE